MTVLHDLFDGGATLGLFEVGHGRSSGEGEGSGSGGGGNGSSQGRGSIIGVSVVEEVVVEVGWTKDWIAAAVI